MVFSHLRNKNPRSCSWGAGKFDHLWGGIFVCVIGVKFFPEFPDAMDTDGFEVIEVRFGECIGAIGAAPIEVYFGVI